MSPPATSSAGHVWIARLELAVAATGVLATMPYIALQLIGMEVAIKALGPHGETPLVLAFLVLALYPIRRACVRRR